MKQILGLFTMVLMLGLYSCDNTTQTTTVVSDYSNQGLAKQVLQTSNYTYILVNEGSKEYWIAVSRMAIEEGQTVYFDQGAEMVDFHSKELDQDFASIFFVSVASLTPRKAGMNTTNPMQGSTPQKPELTKQDIKVERAEGSISIAELYNNKANYSGKTVKITGKVTKANPEIMSRNWYHIQDGTSSGEFFDLTLTSSEMINVGATVTFEGVIAVDKDFGAGYFYPVIMENSKVVK